MTSGSSSWRAESRLLDSAVRDAVSNPGMPSNGGNSSRRRESGFKRLRSVVVGGTDHPDSVSEANGRHYHLKPRLDISRQGSKVPPGIAVALKAAAAAAEDVNNTTKVRGRSSGSVWDRLGNRNSDSLGVKESEAQEGGRVDLDSEVEDAWDNVKIGGADEARLRKRPRWKKLSDRLGKGPREEGNEIAMAPDLGSGSIRYLQGKGTVESKWPDSVTGRMKDTEGMSGGDDHFDDAENGEVGGFFRYGIIKDLHEHLPGKSQVSGSLQYRLGGSEKEKAAQGLQQGLISSLSGAASPLNIVQNIHINSNVRYLHSMDTDAALKDPRDLYPQISKGASMENAIDQSPGGVDTNDVFEMKKRMRQVQLEMTKLRAKQAEVSKEVQKVGSTPGQGSLKARSQEEVDLHSVYVTNIHFAATKEAIATHFSNCGDIVSVTILNDAATGKPRGSAYVEFVLEDTVEKALNLNDSSLLSRSLKIVRKDAAMESTAPTSHGSPYVSVRQPGKFLRGTPVNLRRPSSISRLFPGTANLHWKRETSSPGGTNVSPNFGLSKGPSIPPSARVGALWSPTSLMANRYGPGPIRMTRSMSYVRPAPYPPQETPSAAQQQQLFN